MAEEAKVAGSMDVHGNTYLGVTPKGKEIYMVREYNKTLRFIKFGSGGVVPASLQGGYSSIRMAQQACDSYLCKLNAKQINESGEELKQVKKA